MITDLFNLMSRAIKGTDNIMKGYVTITEVADVHAQRILAESKELNEKLLEELEPKVQAKFQKAQEQWAPLTSAPTTKPKRKTKSK